MNDSSLIGASALQITLSPSIPFAQSRTSWSRSCEPTENFAIECKNLCYAITARNGNWKPILKNCSFSVPSGELWMLFGPNASGKSTLLKILAGLLNPNEGFFRVKKPRSYVFQNPDHQVVMPTVQDDVAFGLSKFNLTLDDITSRVAKALDAVGMHDYLQRPIQTLSGGQKQRVAIAGALAETCKVLLLDELTTFLDETDQDTLKKLKEQLPDELQNDIAANDKIYDDTIANEAPGYLRSCQITCRNNEVRTSQEEFDRAVEKKVADIQMDLENQFQMDRQRK